MAKLTSEQLEELIANPKVRQYLDAISWAEGTTENGYNTTFGNGRVEDLSSHPNKVWGKTGDGATTATGRYQFIGSTFNNIQKQYDLPDFGPKSQDMAAVALIAQRGALDDVLSGNINQANKKLSKEWASLPYNTSKNQSHRSAQDFADVYASLGNGIVSGVPNMWMSPDQTAEITSLYTPNQGQQAINTAAQLAQPVQGFGAEQTPNLAFGRNNLAAAFGNESQSFPAEEDLNAWNIASALGKAPNTERVIPSEISKLIDSIFKEVA